jgi:hypothetical protein
MTTGKFKDAEEMYKKSLSIFTSIGNEDLIKKIKSSMEELKNLGGKS